MVEGKPQEIRADLVVGADGRHSTVRAGAGFEVKVLGAPMDVLWFRLTHKPADKAETMGRFDRGSILVMLDRGDYWQCAYVIAKGSAETLKAAGIEKFREKIAELMPFLADRVHELATVDDLKLLTAISDGMVALLKEFYGRGPSRAKSYYEDDLVVCLLRGGFSRVEQTLLEGGRGSSVIRQRMEFQELMRERFEAVIAEATGRRCRGCSRRSRGRRSWWSTWGRTWIARRACWRSSPSWAKSTRGSYCSWRAPVSACSRSAKRSSRATS
jgi:uncharacterized protein YbcI